ncbi:MAG: ornithine cyclodeaminase family protein [Gammaproteobacteria bacterium]|nr:ornithine cyclodeaminase family protein [Gammaproteobacteria bacterium]
MSAIISLSEIKKVLAEIDLLAAMERAFLNYSSGNAVVPPVGELVFENPPGDVHIKYGYVRGDDYYVVKIASGFYHNAQLDLPSSNGLMLLFSQRSGELRAILLDQGFLTDMRTAAAGAVAARYLAPATIQRIGIIGTGIQAEWQLRLLPGIVDCPRVLVCGRHHQGLQDYCQRLADTGYEIEITDNPTEVADCCQLIVTTTPSCEALLRYARPGTHITAVGADTAEKQELDSAILAGADKIVVDSRAQAQSRGEAYRALQAGAIALEQMIELGEIIAGEQSGRDNDEQITVADLTGVATQDIEIATAVYESLLQNAD